ncbi:hypothetical protein ES332_D02G138800v1 [Gossypium tomentosum]|uniref:Uncharacterized protein n=1 Tax=Gossypium tomentosum TaxID=34277 RepID=A0A5D2LWX3_GOSTO|nr:hypothetical protein ES332_D02G138800v1 [Gossypium tomentosum]
MDLESPSTMTSVNPNETPVSTPSRQARASASKVEPTSVFSRVVETKISPRPFLITTPKAAL